MKICVKTLADSAQGHSLMQARPHDPDAEVLEEFYSILHGAYIEGYQE